MSPNRAIGLEWALFTFSSKPHRAWLLTFAVALLGGCGGGGDFSVGSAGGQSLTLTLPSSYSLKWSDEFSTDGAPGPAWTYDRGTVDPLQRAYCWGNNERQYYTDTRANSFVLRDELTIQPLLGLPDGVLPNLDGCSLLATSARLKTDTAAFYNALNSTPYGFYEIKAKVPCVTGAWPAIWMMGKEGTWPDRGEIDIMEWFGGYFANDVNQVQSGVHTRTRSVCRPNDRECRGFGEYSTYQKARVSNMCTDYHKFQMHWTASEILIGVNGVPTFSYKRPANATAQTWPFDQPAHLILNVAVGGGLGGDVNLGSDQAANSAYIKSMALKVDYVKIWQP